MLEIVHSLRDSFAICKKHFTFTKKNIWGIVWLLSLISASIFKIFLDSRLFAAQAQLFTVNNNEDEIKEKASTFFLYVVLSLLLNSSKVFFSTQLTSYLFKSMSDDILRKWINPKFTFLNINHTGGIGPQHIIAKDTKNFGHYFSAVISIFLDGVSAFIAGVLRLAQIDVYILCLSFMYSLPIAIILSHLSKLHTDLTKKEEKSTNRLYSYLEFVAKNIQYIAERNAQNYEISKITKQSAEIIDNFSASIPVKTGLSIFSGATPLLSPLLGYFVSWPLNQTIYPMSPALSEEVGKHILGITKFMGLGSEDFYTNPFLRTLIDRINDFNNRLDSASPNSSKLKVIYTGHDIELKDISLNLEGVPIFINATLKIFRFTEYRNANRSDRKPNIYKIEGRNGVGKTTLFQIFAGLLPHSGQITFPENDNSKNKNQQHLNNSIADNRYSDNYTKFAFISSRSTLPQNSSLEAIIFYPRENPIDDLKKLICKRLKEKNINFDDTDIDTIIGAIDNIIDEYSLVRLFENETIADGEVMQSRGKSSNLDKNSRKKILSHKIADVIKKNASEISSSDSLDKTKNSYSFPNEKTYDDAIREIANTIYLLQKRKAISIFEELGCHNLAKKLCSSTETKSSDIVAGSNGEQQIIKIVQALISYPSPEFLFLDEVFGAIDIEKRKIIASKIQREFPKTAIIYIEHNRSSLTKPDSGAELSEARTPVKADQPFPVPTVEDDLFGRLTHIVEVSDGKFTELDVSNHQRASYTPPSPHASRASLRQNYSFVRQ